MEVGEVMTENVVTVGPETPYRELVDRLIYSGVSGLPVVDAGRKLLGIVTEADLVSKEAYVGRRRRGLGLLSNLLSGGDTRWVSKAGGLVAADVMSGSPLVCGPTDDLREVARRLLEHRIKRMPVVSDGRLVGIVSRHDLLKMFDRPDSEIAGELRALLGDDVKMPPDRDVRASVEGGVATLSGDVRFDADLRVVLAMVREVPGVVGIRSRLKVRESHPHATPGDQAGEPAVSAKTWLFDAR